jgi:hypothetical protein
MPSGLPLGVDLSSPEAQAAIADGLAQLKTAVEHLTATKVRTPARSRGMASTHSIVLSICSVRA